MKDEESAYQLKLVKDYGQIGCGRVVPFAPRALREIVLPIDFPYTDSIATLIVSGDSLTDDDIRDGDILICRTRFDVCEIKLDTICAVMVISTGELMAKKITIHKNKIVLRASNRAVPDAIYKKSDIEIKAIVIGFQRMR